MEIDDQIELLRKRIKRQREEISSTVLLVSEENNLVPGILNNLGHLQIDLIELRTLLKVRSRG
jgi:hypothetical protein